MRLTLVESSPTEESERAILYISSIHQAAEKKLQAKRKEDAKKKRERRKQAAESQDPAVRTSEHQSCTKIDN